VPARRSRRWLVAGAAAAVALVAAGGAAWWWWGPGTGQRVGSEVGSENSIAPCTPPKGEGWSPIALNKGHPTRETKVPNGSLSFTVADAHARAREGTWQVTLATTMKNATPESSYHGNWRYKSLVVGQREFKATCFSPDPNLVSPATVGDALIGFDVRCQPVGYIELVLEGGRISVTDDTLEPGQC
jgi:hypothetical protein